ncbi:MAG: hypothetical protein GXY85_04900 [Candidatus Brocadiaceae bacterium]|nr:hypothetical protein [Candidatus Brocadiaceae bacterium]
MTVSDRYLSYEQALQELQVNRSQLNAFIREGRLTEHVMEGETKFRIAEVQDIKRDMEKSPTVMEDDGGQEPGTELLDSANGAGREPITEMLDQGRRGSAEGEMGTVILEDEEGAGGAGALDTVVLEGDQAFGAGDLATVVLADDEAGGAADHDTEILEEDDQFELEGAEASASADAMATDLLIEGEGREKAKESSAEDFFDFTDALESDSIELEGAAEPAAGAAGPAEDSEEPAIVTDMLDLSAEEDVAEEDLLSEIMDIDEEPGTTHALGDTEDITAEITTMEEPTYEESDLGTVLGAPSADLGEDFGAGAEFAVPYAEPVGAEEQIGGAFVALLVIALIVLAVSMLFVVENGSAFTTGLTSWARFGS